MEADTPQHEPVDAQESASQPNDAQNPGQNQDETVTIQKIQELLKTKNDTSRFVGLALLKSVLDNSQQLREDEAAVADLWQSVSPKFLDRLLRSGMKQSSQEAKDMIDIAVAVLHTFSTLLPDDMKKDPSLIGRIPALVAVVLHRYGISASYSSGPSSLTYTQFKRHHSTHSAVTLDSCKQCRRRGDIRQYRRRELSC